MNEYAWAYAAAEEYGSRWASTAMAKAKAQYADAKRAAVMEALAALAAKEKKHART